MEGNRWMKVLLLALCLLLGGSQGTAAHLRRSAFGRSRRAASLSSPRKKNTNDRNKSDSTAEAKKDRVLTNSSVQSCNNNRHLLSVATAATCSRHSPFVRSSAAFLLSSSSAGSVPTSNLKPLGSAEVESRKNGTSDQSTRGAFDLHNDTFVKRTQLERSTTRKAASSEAWIFEFRQTVEMISF